MTPAQLERCFAIIPFRFLSPEDRATFAPALVEERFPADAVVITQGDTADDRVWLLLEGEASVLDRSAGAPVVVNRISGGHYFGERRALFERPRRFEVRAVTELECASFPGAVFRRLLAGSPAFALALADLFRNKQGLLRPFDRFHAEVARGAANGHLVIALLLRHYRALEPALHPLANAEEIDWDALAYVVRRLPPETTSTLSWFCADELPPRLRYAADVFPSVPTEARRRMAYRLLPGKVAVLLRDGMTDLLDLVTCLCMFAVEARKLRHRISDPETLVALGHGRDDVLPFDASERARLERLWPGDVPRRLLEIAVHHEDTALAIHKRIDDYSAAHGERWTTQIALATRRLLGAEPNALPEEVEVHIVSSNTHSVGNTLSPWFAARRAEILEWGREHRPDVAGLGWVHEEDLAVAFVRDWLVDHPAQLARRRLEEEEDGAVVHLPEGGLTGIEVQLFDLGRLAGRRWDGITVPRPTRPGLLVNIDYAFGQQAEPIITHLLALFGRNVRSISVLGKAGGLEGRRGDVLVARSFVEQTTDTVLDPGCDVDVDALRRALPDRTVHQGRVLTVAGTVLQNRTLLQYYRRVWQCIGLEMEGTWYCKRVLEAVRLGVLSPECRLRFVYYVSDLPLESGHSLSEAMGLQEGIPPLYAVTRHVLARICG